MTHQVVGHNPLGIDLEATPTTEQFPLGMTAIGNGGTDGNWAKYRYVKFTDAVTYVAGHVVARGAAEVDWIVTNDADQMAPGLVPVGVVFQATVPIENDYGWVQIGGFATVLIGSANVIDGDLLKIDGTTDGAADEATAGTHEGLVGQAVATIADAATGRVQLMIREA